MRILRTLLTLTLLAISIAGGAQTISQKAAVPLSAAVTSSPVRITLSWTTLPSTTSITIYRKLKTATSWGTALASPSSTATSYDDNGISVGTAYEYRVVRVAGGVTGQGYICSGIQVPPVDYRGKMILLVDNTFSTSLSSELAALQQDLRADGWAVVRSDLARTASVATVRSTIQGIYNGDASNVKAVFLVGHLAVPYSGNINPDGHSEHLGAWPCDGYYGELNGSWTDNSVNSTAAARPENRNIPGDGKFDQSAFPSTLELQVGRVDFYDMPAFSANETELTRAYLNKLHGFKMKYWTPTARALVFDNLQWVSNPLAASAWRNFAPMVGAANVTAANQGGTLFHQLVDDQSYLWTYSSGGGLQATVGSVLTYNGADRVGTTQDFASTSNAGGVFNLSFGSYFGDWDNKNNFLRAPLASGNALTNSWAAIPAWYFHHMAMGENIGYSTLVSMNNTLYTPLTDGWQSTIGKTHLALMGDPSLRTKFLVPPSNLTVANVGGTASFSWYPSTETVDGYHLYRIDASNGSITRITTNAITATTYSPGTIPYATNTEYMVRAVKLQTDPSGSYYNLSLGSFATTSGAAAADCQGVVGGTALPGSACNDGNACTINDTWNSNCQCAGTAVNLVGAITAAGPTAFCSGGSVALNATSGTGYTYTWYRNGTTISGALASSYTATLAGSYTVVINNGGCTGTSAATTVTVSSAPVATIGAGGSTTFCTGSSVLLSASTGAGYTYTWKLNGTAIGGATNSTYSATQTGSYTVVVTSGGCSSTSAGVSVSVLGPPTAVLSPTGSAGFCTGGNLLLTAATGTGYSYVWKRNGTTISGATASSYTATLAGSYTVVISSNGCSSTSAATMVSVNALPTATISAGGATSFCPGGTVLLSASTGSGYTYAWRLNGITITGATTSTYLAAQAGAYSVVVSNGGCATTSSGTTVTLLSVPTLTCSASPSTGTVSVTASGGTPPYTYLWNTSPAQTTATAAVTASGTYTVTVKGTNGCSATCTVSYSAPSSNVCTGVRTEAQGTWGAPNSTQSAYMTSNFTAAFPSPNYLTIGCGTRLMRFTTPAAIINALPTYGAQVLLPTGTTVNPTSVSNSLIGQLVAAKINVRLDELDPTFAPTSVLLKNMVVASGTFAGMSVQQLINAADQVIGGCSSAYTLSALSAALTTLNNGYDTPDDNSTYLLCPNGSGLVLQQGPASSLLDEAALEVTVFPNPVVGSATIVLHGGADDEEVTIDLMALSGAFQRSLFNGTVEAGTTKQVEWSAEALSPGVYFCRVLQGDRVCTVKVVVE